MQVDALPAGPAVVGVCASRMGAPTPLRRRRLARTEVG
ncbi:hypothetical protein DSM112329_02151 [Paraconexibacter sp. AEG42_29]|uniref:Uncharacterized protein n=1 Tax=Paraconexibacter sp. AEG42_29 TaxID=2997339 RepID=A0AAU7AUK1_9ACTN